MLRKLPLALFAALVGILTYRLGAEVASATVLPAHGEQPWIGLGALLYVSFVALLVACIAWGFGSLAAGRLRSFVASLFR